MESKDYGKKSRKTVDSLGDTYMGMDEDVT